MRRTSRRRRAGSKRAARAAIVLACTAALVPGALARDRAPGHARASIEAKNPCLDGEIRRERKLRCPDLRMRPPFHIDDDRIGGRRILRAANSIDSVGDGPVELRGKRSSSRKMKAEQRIHKLGGGHADFDTGAELVFKPIPGQGPYWKFQNAARMELWLLGSNGERKRLVETGPKRVYCLRDLKHTHGELPRSPNRRVYPSCSQDPSERSLTLGTSVGWSDVYPASYHEQFLNVDRLPRRGCYAYVHVADPGNGILERNEDNNEASTVVYLTKGGDYRRGRCRHVEDRALAPAQTAADTDVPGGGPASGQVPYRER